MNTTATASAETAMEREIAEQPAVLAAQIEHWERTVSSIRHVIPRPVDGVSFVARGSSDNVSVVGRYAVEALAGVPAGLAAPSLATRYGGMPAYRNHLIVAVSQSGMTPEITAAAVAMRGEGSRIVAVTNDASSDLARCADAVLALRAGAELAVPATKTVTAQLLMMLAIATALAPAGGKPPLSPDGLALLPAALDEIIADTPPVHRMVERLGDSSVLQVVGRGFMLGGVLEAAIKIRETTGVFAQGISSADLLHGPIAALRAGRPAWVVDGGGPPATDLAAVTERLRVLGADVFASSASRGSELPLPPVLPELLQPFAAIVRGQQLALHWSLARGLDPDLPVGLSKITETR